ncbi:hypothetical protein [Mesobacillus zeae]|uniref:hypothetical protein n=1 Tax=Mesobacillus zeae TaxID=1917180 RepID=UPI001FE30C42|nr:hypothetical protein [Mesobacillus zeae]
MTIKTISSLFLESTDLFERHMTDWAMTAAKSKVETGTPIHEVIEALRKVRETYWSFVGRFISENIGEVNHGDIVRWSTVINSTFDKMIHKFTELYYELTNARLVAQQALITELGSPVIPIIDRAGVMPLVGGY